MIYNKLQLIIKATYSDNSDKYYENNNIIINIYIYLPNRYIYAYATVGRLCLIYFKDIYLIHEASAPTY